jgi:hypothetical protein
MGQYSTPTAETENSGEGKYWQTELTYSCRKVGAKLVPSRKFPETDGKQDTTVLRVHWKRAGELVKSLNMLA